jgi:hypothetical protein
MATAATNADALRIESGGSEVHHLSWIGTLPGVEILAVAAINGPGAGRLLASADGESLQWRAPGSSTAGAAVDVSAGGTFLLEDGDDSDAWLRIEVTAASLDENATEAVVHLDDRYGNAVASDDVSAAEASAGDVETYTLTLANDSGLSITSVTVWIDSGVSGIEISDDGSTWVSPTTEGGGLSLGTITASGTDTLHVRRTIGSSTSYDPKVLTHLHASFVYDSTTHYSDLRGLYRIFNATEYRFYRTDGSPPQEGDTPFATASSLPDTPTPTFADGDWYLAMSYFNGCIDSGFLPMGQYGLPYKRIVIDSGAEEETPPIGPLDVRLIKRPGGVIRVIIWAMRDGSAEQPDTIAIWTATGFGVPLLPPNTPGYTNTLSGSGLIVVQRDLPAQSDGTVVKVRVHLRRDGVYSDGSFLVQTTADAAGPSAPVGGEQWLGRVPAEVE